MSSCVADAAKACFAIAGWIKAHWGTIANLVLGLINIAGLYILWLFPAMVQLQMELGVSVHDEHYRDALDTAVSLGRLDAVSILLAVLGVMLGLIALFSFNYFRHRAENVARETAVTMAREVAGREAVRIAEELTQVGR